MGGHGWGEISTEKVMEAVSAGLDKGVNFFDTADIYGLGESEKRLGRALKGRRDKAIIATKFGVRIDRQNKTYYDNSPTWIKSALDGSLRRLGVECIDLYQMHYKDSKTPIDVVVEALEEKRREGKIRYYGLSNVSPEDIVFDPLPEGMVSFQLEYSLARRNRENDIIGISRENGLSFLSWGSLGQGILTGNHDVNTKFPSSDRRNRPAYVNFHGEKLKKNMMIVEEMRKISAAISKSPAQIAIRWILDHLGFGTVLTGVTCPEEITENTGAFGWKLSEHDVSVLDGVSKE
ncbi:MAG: aldo/keto reductase [Candidatus Omnitrophica bacterium]|nr:aldo/keto reductase [Candidatus Omnitrophota bacterium]